jgi:hypothetical protein
LQHGRIVDEKPATLDYFAKMRHRGEIFTAPIADSVKDSRRTDKISILNNPPHSSA